MKEMLCEINHALADLVHDQINNLDEVNAKELDKAVHMIKNLSEAIYYCTIVEAMENGENTTCTAIQVETKSAATPNRIEITRP